MPKLNMDAYDEADEITEGESQYYRLGPGGYVAQIQAMHLFPDKQYVKLIYDIADEPCNPEEARNYYSDDFYEDKDYFHQIFLSYKEKAYGFLKHRLNCITESNPGFDAFDAFEHDDWMSFIGKKFGLVLREEEYESNKGEVKKRLGVDAMKTADQIRNGEFEVKDCKPLKKDDGGKRKRKSEKTPDDSELPDAYADIETPF